MRQCERPEAWVSEPCGAGLALSQPHRGYRYSLDPFLLAGFCRPRHRERILDLGTGVGVVGLLLAQRHVTVNVVGIELDRELAANAMSNARANRLDRRFQPICGDLRDAPRFLPPEHFDRVVANPPFRRPGTGATPLDPVRARARQEQTATLGDFVRTAAALLRFGGTLDLVHLTERMPELYAAFAGANLEPKLLQLVVPRASAAARLMLVEAVKGGRPGLRMLPNLVLEQSVRNKKQLSDN